MGSDIQSKEVIDKISDELKVQPAMSIPRELADKIQLVYNVNPVRVVRILNSNANDSVGGTFFTTHPTRRTFLVGASLIVSKSVLSISVNSTFTAIAKGQAAASFLRLNYEPVTAGEHHTEMDLSFPIELEKNSIMALNNQNATASIDTNIIVYIFETDPQ